MIDSSPAAGEAEGFIRWMRAERYTDYIIDCHIRRLLFVMPRLSPGSAPPMLRDADLLAVFGRERRPRSRFFYFAGTRRVYTRYLRAQSRLVPEPQTPSDALIRGYDQYLTDVRGLRHQRLPATRRRHAAGRGACRSHPGRRASCLTQPACNASIPL